MLNHLNICLKNFVLHIFALLISFCIVNQLNCALELNVNTIWIILFIFLFTSLFNVFFNHIKLTKKFYLRILGVFAVLLILGLPFGITAKFISQIRSFIIWCYEYFNDYENIVVKYQFTFIILISLLICIFSYFFIYKNTNLIAVFSVSLFVYVLIWSYKLPFDYLSFYIFCISMIMLLFTDVYIKKSSHPGNYSSLKYSIIWMSAICAIIFVISYKIPSPSLPIQFPWLDEKINALLDDGVWSYDFFSFNNAGYIERNANLGGKIEQDFTPVLEVTTPYYIYLRGNSYDYYDGTKWTSTDKSSYSLDNQNNSVFNDILELTKGTKYLAQNSDDFLKGIISKRKIYIKYLNLRTKTIFYPLKTISFICGENKKIHPYVNVNSAMFSKKMLSPGFSYSVESYYIDYNKEDALKLLERSNKSRYSSEASIPEGLSLNDLNKLVSISKNAYSKYLQIPDDFPSSIFELSYSLVETCNSNYEKAKKIEGYLSVNYAYTLEVGDIPKGADFVESFLFDTKQGYCTYYATAMTMMLRTVGIPARYVEGYILPEDAAPNVPVTITNQNAHAWVEAYFEGFGWVPFEPTSPFTERFHNNEFEQNTQTENNIDIPASIIESEEETISVAEVSNSFDSAGDELIISQRQKIPTVVKIIIISILIILAVFIPLFLYTNSHRAIRKIKSAFDLPSRESIISMYYQYLKIFSILGLPIESNETPLQYAQRVHNEYEFSKLDIIEVTNIFLKARYGKSDLEYKEKRTVYRMSDDLHKMPKKLLNKAKYFVYRYLLGKV